jgi:hypothetical protein
LVQLFNNEYQTLILDHSNELFTGFIFSINATTSSGTIKLSEKFITGYDILFSTILSKLEQFTVIFYPLFSYLFKKINQLFQTNLFISLMNLKQIHNLKESFC